MTLHKLSAFFTQLLQHIYDFSGSLEQTLSHHQGYSVATSGFWVFLPMKGGMVHDSAPIHLIPISCSASCGR
jgi:hypothetical protein